MNLLHAGEANIIVFGDGSFSSRLGAGASAWQVPGFGARGSWCDVGEDNNRFEMLAIVMGLEFVFDVDNTDRPIELLTDSDYVVRLFRSMGPNAVDGSRPKSEKVLDLVQRAENHGHQNSALPTLRRSPSPPSSLSCRSPASITERSGER